MKDIFCLSGFADHSAEISEPLRHTNRIKYTSYDASQNYYVLGASSGSLYLFSRKVCEFLCLIPNKYGHVVQVAISTNETYVAFVTQKGVICVYVVNLSTNSTPQVLSTTSLGVDAGEVTCIHWSQDEKRFYYGNKKGQVNLVLLNSFMNRTLINLSVHPILFLDSPIVQIDDFESLLLVSNYSKCILCNTEFEEYKQIGNRPRDGDFGACFVISPNEQLSPSRIICARPGSRFWEVDFEGNVLQTHQFKSALACAPAKIQKLLDGPDTILKYEENDELIDFQPQNLQFSKLQTILGQFLLTFSEFGLFVFDLKLSKVILWCNQFERIDDCKVVGDDIVVFSGNGSLCSVKLQHLEAYAISLVHEERLLDCSLLLKKNLKYFADRAREDYKLESLNQIKNYLIDRNQYELLNDLSVIFDSIAQNKLVNENSSGSSGDRDLSSEKKSNEKTVEKAKGVYVLENSFCDNLRIKSTSEKDRQLKDALLTVTGKFGKNIIKYKLNIFSDEQKSLVNDLIPADQRVAPFRDINQFFTNDEEIVCKKATTKTKRDSRDCERIITDEEKTIYNLFLISRSSQISNTNFLDRYRMLFDEYTSREIIALLSKLEAVMIENGDTTSQAKKNCYEMYFNYLKPELVWELDDNCRDFIINGFVFLNASENIIHCDNCDFPIRYDNACQYHELGETLFKYLWSRNEHHKCFKILSEVPAIFDVLCRFYSLEHQMDKVIPIVLNYGEPSLLEEMGKTFDLYTWDRCFEMFVALQKGRLTCVNCHRVTVVQNVNRHFFYTWNCFITVSLQFLKSSDILMLIFKYSNLISNDAIDRELFTKLLLKRI